MQISKFHWVLIPGSFIHNTLKTIAFNFEIVDYSFFYSAFFFFFFLSFFPFILMLKRNVFEKKIEFPESFNIMKRFREYKTLKWICLVESIALATIFFCYVTQPNIVAMNDIGSASSQISIRRPVLQQKFQSIPVPPGYSLESWLSMLPYPLVFSKLFQGAMGDFELAPYFWRANTEFDQDVITITTMITEERINRLEMLVQSYPGPISVTFHLTTSYPNTSEVFERLLSFYTSNLEVQNRVDLHVLRDGHSRQFNLWRNIARLFARTQYIFNIDADFKPSPQLKYFKHRNASEIYIVPAFEVGSNVDIPKTKEDLHGLWKSGKATRFHAKFTPGHNATMYETWFSTDRPYRVTHYHISYEPYWIMERNRPVWCDERFVGYGANKAVCIFEMYTAGLEFIVLPDVFLVHMEHPYPEETRKIERLYNRELYDAYRIELCVKYKRKKYPNAVDYLMEFREECSLETARPQKPVKAKKSKQVPHVHEKLEEVRKVPQPSEDTEEDEEEIEKDSNEESDMEAEEGFQVFENYVENLKRN